MEDVEKVAPRLATDRNGHAVRSLADAVMTFDLNAEADALRREARARGLTHDAVTLVKHADVRVVLMTMDAGSTLKRHQARDRLTVHCLRGRVRVGLDGHDVELGAGQLLVLDRNLAHDVSAVEASELLLSMAYGPGANGAVTGNGV